MYKIRTVFNFEASHRLNLPYQSKCNRLHGHSYKCAVTIRSAKLNKEGMIVDFTFLKQIINDNIIEKLDHTHLCDVFNNYNCNTTAEFMAKWIADEVNEALMLHNIPAICSKVELNETEKNMAIWEEDRYDDSNNRDF